jgi:oligoendopeptidase F
MKKLNTEWNLGLLYKSEKDPKIEKDLKLIEKSYLDFETKYKKVDFTRTPSTLLRALKDWEKLNETQSQVAPWWYFALRSDLNSEDKIAQANATKNEQRLTTAANKVEFFKLKIAKIPTTQQKKFLNNPILKPYKYSLERVFKASKYFLTEQEEQLASLLNGTSYEMWIQASENKLNNQTISHNNKKITLTEAIGRCSELPKRERRILHEKINQSLKSISDIAEGEMNAIYNYKKIMDERRGFEKPYSDTILGHENEEKNIEMLVSLISKNFRISHRFYKLHAKLLKEKRLSLADRNAKIGKIKKKFDFEGSVNIVKESFAKVDKKYSDILDDFLNNKQIDVFPKKGKRGGAYCWGTGKLPTFVLLNHLDNIRSVETLAHEMGHAIHNELSKNQPPRYRHYSTACAEVASTFFEQLVSEDLVKHLSKEEQIVLLHNKIQGDIATIFRQIAFFNFENDLHLMIREKGQVTKEEMAVLMNKHIKSYLGPIFDFTEDDGYFYVYISHLRRFFYVYTYSYGQIVSRALYENWLKDPSYKSKIEQFLSSGRSKSPEDIFKSVGIDTSKPEFFQAGLDGLERDIISLEKLTGGNKK